MDICACGCGQIVPDKRVARSKHHKIFLNDQHRIDFHKADDKARRRAIWEAAPPKTCEECQRLFKPAFQSGWPKRKRCPECMLTPMEHNRRRRAEEKKGGPKHTKRPWHVNGLDLGKQWKCRGCGKMSNNRLDCPECKARILAKEDSWLDDYAVETLDIANMGLMPY